MYKAVLITGIHLERLKEVSLIDDLGPAVSFNEENPWITTCLINKKYFAYSFYPHIFRHNGRSFNMGIRRAIFDLTLYSFDARSYEKPVCVIFLPDELAMRIKIMYPSRVMMRHDMFFMEDLGKEFADYLYYLLKLPVRERREPTDRTIGVMKWLKVK